MRRILNLELTRSFRSWTEGLDILSVGRDPRVWTTYARCL